MAEFGTLCGTLTFFVLFVSVCGTEYSICNIPCCSVQPNCEDALHVDCDCPDLDSITLREGDIPPSVQSISISASGQLTITKHAFYDLPSLMFLCLDLDHEGTLNVGENGMALKSENSGLSLIIENAKSVNFANSAFAGSWTEAATIRLRTVQSLYMQQNSFIFHSKGNGPSLIMDYVGNLHLAPDALNAPISSLDMSNVNMPTCLSGSFGEHLSRMRMNHVRINRARAGCVKTSRMVKLSIGFSTIETVQSQGLVGKIRDVDIYDTDVMEIEEDGFLLNVTALRVKRCLLDDVMALGLNVIANNSINFESVNITSLRKHALSGLRVAANQNDPRHVTKIQKMSVTYAEKGSLAFSEQSNLRIAGRLNVPVPDPPICPPEKWARLLVGTPEGEQLSDAGNEILRKVNRSWLCPDTNSLALQDGASQRRTETDHPERHLGYNGRHLGYNGRQRTSKNKGTAKVLREKGRENLTPVRDDDAEYLGATHKNAVRYDTEADVPSTPQIQDVPNAPETTATIDLSQESASGEVRPPSTGPKDASNGHAYGALPSKRITTSLRTRPIVITVAVVSVTLIVCLLFFYLRRSTRDSGEGRVDSRLETEPLQTRQDPASEEVGEESTSPTMTCACVEVQMRRQETKLGLSPERKIRKRPLSGDMDQYGGN